MSKDQDWLPFTLGGGSSYSGGVRLDMVHAAYRRFVDLHAVELEALASSYNTKRRELSKLASEKKESRKWEDWHATHYLIMVCRMHADVCRTLLEMQDELQRFDLEACSTRTFQRRALVALDLISDPEVDQVTGVYNEVARRCHSKPSTIEKMFQRAMKVQDSDEKMRQLEDLIDFALRIGRTHLS